MKKFVFFSWVAGLLFSSFALTGAKVANAQYMWFPVHAYVTWNPLMVQAQVVNSSLYPMYCHGFAYGQTYAGQILNSFGSGFYVAPGQYAFLYVYTHQHNPFIRGWAQVQCRY